MLRRLLLPAVAGLTLFASFALADAKLTIVHVNDIDQMSEVRGAGGTARLAAVVKAERARAEHLLVTHGGDMISPSLLSGFDRGAHMVALMNAIGLDVMVLGNHEFDFGPDVLEQRLAEANYVQLAGNVRRNGAPLPHTVDTHMVTVGAYKVGIVGLVTPDTAFLASPGPTVTFADEIDTARTLASALRDAGADLVIALAHLPLGRDQALLHEKIGVDIVLAGHDHLLHADYDGAGLIAQASSQASYVAVLDIDLRTVESRGRKRFAWQPDVRFVRTDHVTPDPDVAAMVKRYEDDLSKELDQPLGVTETELDSRRATIRSTEAAIGNVIADAMRIAVDADVALTNSGGIRGNRIYDPGHTLTRRDILTELPFGNRTMKLELTGAALRQALEHGFSQAEDGAGRFPQVSGLTVTWNPKAAPGARVVAVSVGNAPLDDARVYTLATNDYIARGGDGYDVFKDAKVLIDADGGRLMAAQVMDYIAQLGQVAPKVDGRITAR
ncbi:MAG: 5'-nucleotidase C-terminal domain-containing protein [Alphaproteobacteria bacterium]